MLSDHGSIFVWPAGSGLLYPAPSPLTLDDLGGTINHLAGFADGTRLLVLTPNPGDPGKGRKRRDGLALIYDLTSGKPRILHQVPLEGDGYAVAIGPDGRSAYILAARLQSRRGGPRFWIHAVDLEEGLVEDSTLLDRPAVRITVSGRGDRLFVSQEGRVQTFSTRPLVSSWFYRSPGPNGELYFAPGSDTLYALREGQIALFDPQAILERARSEGRDRPDDVTQLIALPFNATSIHFSEDGGLAALLGAGPIAFVELRSGEIYDAPDLPAVLDDANLARLLSFQPDGNLLVGLFPAGIVVRVRPPDIPSPPLADDPVATDPTPITAVATLTAATGHSDRLPIEPDGASAAAGSARIPASTTEPPGDPEVQPTQGDAPATSKDAPPFGPPPTNDLPQPEVAPPVLAPAPEPPPVAEPEIVPTHELFLAGRVSGELRRVAAIVLYGPDSIIREYARVAPSADGAFSFPLPPAGAYRLVPIGEASQPLSSRPNFHSVRIKANEAPGRINFEIGRGP